jgi:hypothetical protein
MRLLPRHGDADRVLGRDEVIDALSVLSNRELDSLDATGKLVPTRPVRTLDQNARRLLDGSRMTRECHVRFCERLGVKLPGATLPGVTRSLETFRCSEGKISFLAIVIVSAASLPPKHREWPERLPQVSAGAWRVLNPRRPEADRISICVTYQPGSCARRH